MLVNLKVALTCVAVGMMAFGASSPARTNVAASDATPAPVSSVAPDSSNPYSVIIDRNVFRLNPPPPPPAPDVPKPADLPKIFLTGIVKIGNDTRVLFAMPSKDAKENTYFNLAQGEKDGVLELVKIYPEREAVDVVNSGTAMTLSIASNSITPLAATGGFTAPANQSGNPGGFPVARRMGGFNPPSAPAPSQNSVVAGGQNYSSPSSDSGVTVAGGGSSTGGGGSPNGTLQALNGLLSGNQSNTQVGNPGSTGPLPDPDVQAAKLLLDKTIHGEQSPPLPPPLANLLNGGNGQVGDENPGAGQAGNNGNNGYGGPPALPPVNFQR